MLDWKSNIHDPAQQKGNQVYVSLHYGIDDVTWVFKLLSIILLHLKYISLIIPNIAQMLPVKYATDWLANFIATDWLANCMPLIDCLILLHLKYNFHLSMFLCPGLHVCTKCYEVLIRHVKVYIIFMFAIAIAFFFM